MMQLLTLLLMLLPTMSRWQAVDLESRQKEIGQAISESPRYVAKREAKIAVACRPSSIYRLSNNSPKTNHRFFRKIVTFFT